MFLHRTNLWRVGLTTVLRKHILEGHCYRFSKIEQRSENLHTIFNSLERRFAFGITIASGHTITLYVQTCRCLNKFVIRTARNTGFNVRPFDVKQAARIESSLSIII